MKFVSNHKTMSGTLLLALLAFVVVSQLEGARASPSGAASETVVEHHLDTGPMHVERFAELEAEEYDPQVLTDRLGDGPMYELAFRMPRRTTPWVIDLAADDPSPD